MNKLILAIGIFAAAYWYMNKNMAKPAVKIPVTDCEKQLTDYISVIQQNINDYLIENLPNLGEEEIGEKVIQITNINPVKE